MLAAALLSASAMANDLVVGRSAPPVEMTTLDGRHINTRDLLGQVVIVTFWATWCSPCHEELPLLSAYAKAHAAQGLTVLAISLDSPDQLPDVRAMSASLPFATGLLEGARLPGYGRIWHVPVSFTIDRKGKLVDNGWDDAVPVWTQDRLDNIVSPLLSSK